MAKANARTPPEKNPPVPLLIRAFEDTGHLTVPEQDFGAPADGVRVAVLLWQDGGWVAFPYHFLAWYPPAAGLLVIDLPFTIHAGLLLVYPARPKEHR